MIDRECSTVGSHSQCRRSSIHHLIRQVCAFIECLRRVVCVLLRCLPWGDRAFRVSVHTTELKHVPDFQLKVVMPKSDLCVSRLLAQQ